MDVVCGSSVAASQHAFFRTSLALWGFVTYVQLTSAALTHIYTHMSMRTGRSLAHFSMWSVAERGGGGLVGLEVGVVWGGGATRPGPLPCFIS